MKAKSLSLPFPLKVWQEWGNAFYSTNKKITGFAPWKIDVVVMGKHRIQRLNREYLGKNRPTDVLSFPHFHVFPVRPKSLIVQNDGHLGSIAIGVENWISQAKKFGVTPRAEFFYLMTHGVLHLMGEDHERSAKCADRMQAYEDQIMSPLLKNKKL